MHPPHDDEPAYLELLRVLEDHPDYTQRQLSHAMGLSLGKTHYLLKALLEKGFVKVDNFRRNDHKLGYVYVLTASGVRERMLMTRSFLARKEREFTMLQSQISRLRSEIAERPEP